MGRHAPSGRRAALLLAASAAGALSDTPSGESLPAHSPISIPAFLDCAEEQHGEWARFRELWHTVPWKEGEIEDGGNFPDHDTELAHEAFQLYQKWYPKLAKGLEDYPLGSSDFYHRCHWEEQSNYCLYGHIAVLAYLGRYVVEDQRYDLVRHALRLLNWNQCLDFLESSSWGISMLHLWDQANGFVYPMVTKLHQYFFIGEGHGGPREDHAAFFAQEEEEEAGAVPNFWVFEMGTHKALSNEPITMLQRALPGYHVLHQNFVKPYEGRAEAFRHPFPRECSPNCQYQQDSVPYTYPVFEDLEDSVIGLRKHLLTMELRKPEVRRASVFLCTNPIYYCSFFKGFGRTIIGYFGLPLLYMVPDEDWGRWLRDYAELAASPGSWFFANNPLLAEQIAWQSGAAPTVLRPTALYIKETYYPTRMTDVLVPEPREACVLNCLLRRFTPPDYPLRFFEKADTDRTFRTFASFRSIVIFPHDYALMIFYEFYSMGVPLFMPADLSKYLFPYSATVPLLDWVPEWVRSTAAEGSTAAGEHSPLSLTSVAALKHWSKQMDFFSFPAVQLFPSIAGLLEMLPKANLHDISIQMRDSRTERLIAATDLWQACANAALADGKMQD